MASVWPRKTISRWESRALAVIYTAIFLIALAFALIIYQAAHLIGTSNTSIDSSLYFTTHLGTFIFEIILWVIIARAAVRLKAYSRSIIGSKDGQALDYIANAFLLSLAYAMLFGMASTVKTLFWHTSFLDAATIITNLLPVAMALLFSILLWIGSRKLTEILTTRFEIFGHLQRNLSLLVFCLGAGAFATYLCTSAPKIIDDDGLRHFAMAPRLLFFTYILPYIAVWLFGLLACMNVIHYARQVKGTIYRQLFHNLYLGLVISFIGTYLAQIFYLSNLPSNRFGPGLLIIVGIILLLVKGCLLIYRGVSQLSLIEQ